MGLAVPASIDELYEARGDEVPLTRPLLPGDVFSDVELPGLEDGRGLAMILMHPCSMRTGPTLRKRLTMVRVTPHRDLTPEQWPDGDYDFMPLPDLPGLAESPMPAANFRSVSPVKSATLDPRKRIAVLSTRGLLYLQQRRVHSETRVVVDLDTLQRQMDPVLDETELQEDWAELALRLDGGTREQLDVIRSSENDFQAFMGGAESDLRRALRDETRRTDARRQIRAAARAKYQQP